MYLGRVTVCRMSGPSFRTVKKQQQAPIGSGDAGQSAEESIAHDMQTSEEGGGSTGGTSTGGDAIGTGEDAASSTGEDSKAMTKKGSATIEPVQYDVDASPVVEKLLDEALTNSIDHSLEDSTQRNIRVDIDPETGLIGVYNDGKGIPCVKFEKTEQYVPEVIFSVLRSSSKFGEEERLTGGMNGFGIKLVNIWSKLFRVTCVDAVNHRKFTQTWSDNMKDSGKATNVYCGNKKGSTHVEFIPDYARMGMSVPLSDEVVLMLQARVYDACACTASDISVFLNGSKIAINGFMQYAQTSFGSKLLARDSVEVDGTVRFEVALADDSSNRTIGFVNGVRCSNGTHMDMCVRKACEVLTAKLRAKSKRDDVSVKPSFFREHVGMVVSVRIPNAKFTSQEKSTLETQMSKFGFSWTPSKAFVAGLEKSSLIDRALNATAITDQKAANKTTRRVSLPNKYDPAHDAGKRGNNCTLIVTEGDSAKAMAVCGLEVVGRKRFGVFPIRGKLFNVRNVNLSKAMDNAEIRDLTRILNLEIGKTYDRTSALQTLRYRHVAIFADQDVDGAHIAGLLINFVHHHHPTLLKALPDFFIRFATPIVRATRGPAVRNDFFSQREFDVWYRGLDDAQRRAFKIKYYKGLGTSTAADSKEYFRNWSKHAINVVYNGDDSDARLKLFFESTRADERKEMLSSTDINERYVDYSKSSTCIENYLDNEVIFFSRADVDRSIPSAIDGFKPSQRKAFYGFRERKFLVAPPNNKTIKVAQAGAAVAEVSCYHQGENSLIETIVQMAQDHWGTNNLNLFLPEGQFGTRLKERKVHSAARYIFTGLKGYTSALFPPDDDPVLENREDDGQTVEPVHYVPVLPMVLVNGGFGIGTGYSTSVPNYSLESVMAACRAYLSGGDEALAAVRLLPHFNHFRGTVEPTPDKAGCYTVSGTYETRGTVVTITELPICAWTDDYIEKFKSKHEDDPGITKIVNHSTTSEVRIEIHYTREGYDKVVQAGVEKSLGLTTQIQTTNMYLFDADEHLKKYESPHEIVRDHAIERLRVYGLKKVHLLGEMRREKSVLENRIRFVEMDNAGELGIDKPRSTKEIEDVLQAKAFDRHVEKRTGESNYAYLLDMTFRSKTFEALARMKSALERVVNDIGVLERKTVEQMWREELAALDDALQSKGTKRTRDDETLESGPSAKLMTTADNP